MVLVDSKNILALFQVPHNVFSNALTERKMEKLQMELLLMLQRKENVIVNMDKLGEIRQHPGKIHSFVKVRISSYIIILDSAENSSGID